MVINEFTVAPQLDPPTGELPYHEWFVEMDDPISADQLESFKSTLDQEMRQQNSYYDDLIRGKVLQPLQIKILKTGAFQQYMKSIGKLGARINCHGFLMIERLQDSLKVKITVRQSFLLQFLDIP